MAGTIALISLQNDSSNSPQSRWKDGQFVSVYPLGTILGNKVQVESGNFYWLVFVDREPEEMDYLTEARYYNLTFEELAGGSRLRFTLGNPSPDIVNNFPVEKVEEILSNTRPVNIETVLTLFSSTNTSFVVSVDYAAGDTPNTVGNAVVDAAETVLLSPRRWRLTTAGFAAIRNSDYEWQDGSGKTGGRLDDVFTELERYLLDTGE